jgi:hypothetical protein
MKGQVVLEYPFQMFLYIVVILVVISLIITFRTQILTYLKLCDYLPQGCQSQQECSTFQTKETTIDTSVLTKYCNLCWDKTGKIDYGKDCLCYIVSGSYSPITFTNKNCELKCDKQATAVFFAYDNLLKEISIKC